MDETAFQLHSELEFSPLAHEGHVEWLLGRHSLSGETFVLATATTEEAEHQVTQLLRHEYALRTRLADTWSLKPPELHLVSRALCPDLFPFYLAHLSRDVPVVLSSIILRLLAKSPENRY